MSERKGGGDARRRRHNGTQVKLRRMNGRKTEEGKAERVRK